MRVRDARAVAARWAAEAAHEGAFLSGSLTWLPGDAEVPAASDVDVMVVAPGARPKLGKFRREGALLEVTYLTWADLPSPEAVLGHYHLAGAFKTDHVLTDPSGRLRALQAAVGPRWAQAEWVRRRCEHAERRVVEALSGTATARTYPARVMALLFGTGITTHVLLTAGLRNPTVRLRYPAARQLLMQNGFSAFYEELLDLLGSTRLGPGRVERHLAALTSVFDEAAHVEAAPYPFASDISPQARHIAVHGSRELIARGLHREAMFWIAVTYARCLRILGRAESPGFREILADLGADDPVARAADVTAVLPRLRQVAERIIERRGGA
ncbi:hypothetical protein [Nonomuraea longicatena]|uniref:Polymerase nucleotidyl transferase domain-containing protein n=1 Tax=Nonomuraea longicatena TaxID=83682 RepID=A0ABN1NPJ7_9ACTN